MKKTDEVKKFILQEVRRRISSCLSSALPSEAEYAAQLGVSRGTVRRALLLLKEEGIVESRKGSGWSLSGRVGAGEDEIAVCVSDVSLYLTPEFCRDVESVLSAAGYHVSIYETGGTFCRERSLLKELKEHAPRGVIAEKLWEGSCVNRDLYEDLRARKTKLLFLGGSYPDFKPDAVSELDYASAVYELCRGLRETGHRRITGIFCRDDLSGISCAGGFLRAMADYPDDYVLFLREKAFYRGEGRAETDEAAAAADALITENDMAAAAILQRLQRLKRDCTDLPMFSFDRSFIKPAGFLSLPPSISPGKAVAREMLALLRGAAVPSEPIRFRLEGIPNGSQK